MTSVITPIDPQRRLARDFDDAVTAPIPLLWGSRGAPASASHLTPASTVRSAPTGSSRSAPLVIAAAMLALVALAAVAAAAYLAGAHSTAAVSPAPTAAAASAPATASSAAASDRGPQLLEADGNPIDSQVADEVRDVYDGLANGDLAALRVSYGAAGSDDGTTIEPRLRSAATRAQLLAALRTHPTHDGNSYTYRHGSYSVEFSQALGPLSAGLERITGPWTSSTASTSTPKASTTTTASAPATSASSSGSSCAAGTHSGGDGFYPCTDNATGAAVGYDGTFGVHGLKPCPPATRLTNPVGHNPKTGATCAMP